MSGIAIKVPAIPQIQPQKIKLRKTTRGFNVTIRPIIIGVLMLPS